ncbi:hypothetical protein Misp01_78940 [Microtetraspora sp. NBRC 13810]|uniref:hypothetical protein n=1 Tax=Microtetraspora sp. NBRC 13810 TaxID=3030990 RepID=UPI0024A3E595|nr:hypothetical protein [Microtetraspora sp. NBRC 13810]GLW12766.1 hypothetical protein Misp01_78940 [Microtetraspora sp. NBRC 13810]
MNTETQSRAPSEQDDESGRGAVRRATALAGLGSVADVAAIAQLVTTESRHGVLVAGLLSVLAGTLGLIQLYGRPVQLRAMVMVALIAVGAGLTGAMIQQYRVDAGAEGTPAASTATPAASTTPPPTPTPTPSAPTAGAPTTVPRPTASPPAGGVIREAEASLRDQDYLDVETGRIGTIDPAASDLWYVSPYRSLWTAGGGEYPITTVEARPDSAGCARELAARDYDQVEVGRLTPGSWACARTAEGNLVAIRFSAIPTGDAPLRISYIVWRLTSEE